MSQGIFFKVLKNSHGTIFSMGSFPIYYEDNFPHYFLAPRATSLASFSIKILWITLLKHLKPCRYMNNFMVWEWNSQTFSYLAHLRNDPSLVEIFLVTKLTAIEMGDHKKIEGTVVFSVVGRPNAILTSKNAIWVCVKYKIVLIKKFNILVLKL